MGFRDTSADAGGDVQVHGQGDRPVGNTLTLPDDQQRHGGGCATGPYTKDVVGDGAVAFWRLGEPSGLGGYDYAGFNDMTANAAVTRGATGAIAGDTDTASTFDGDKRLRGDARAPVAGPDVFTEEAWFKTTSTTGGKIVGFGNQNTGNSTNYDRHIYMDHVGQRLLRRLQRRLLHREHQQGPTTTGSGTTRSARWTARA